jgi:hypothetical protein
VKFLQKLVPTVPRFEDQDAADRWMRSQLGLRPGDDCIALIRPAQLPPTRWITEILNEPIEVPARLLSTHDMDSQLRDTPPDTFRGRFRVLIMEDNGPVITDVSEVRLP